MLIIQRPTVEAIGEEEDNRQKFAVGPLDPGFGHTLGNSLRRTLLSSIPGAAITQVRFDEALHEFTTLPGVKEDVTDIILNLKDLLFKVYSDEPVTIRLDKRGPGAATAGDIRWVIIRRRYLPQLAKTPTKIVGEEAAYPWEPADQLGDKMLLLEIVR